MNPKPQFWSPVDIPAKEKKAIDFVDGLRTIAGAGSPQMRYGLAYHSFIANTSMENRAMQSADGDIMICKLMLFSVSCPALLF